MNKTTVTMTIIALSLALASPLFASGAMENGVEFKTLDLSTSSISDMESAWQNSVENYNNQREGLRKAMNEAYEEKDVSDYLELRSIYKALEVPCITKEQTDTLVERIQNSSDKEEKDKIASFLYENSIYYRPTLTFKYTVDANGFSRTLSRSVSALPGTQLTVPSVEGEGVFLGWSQDGESVLYKGGEEVEMPYTDTVLYAIFTSGITFKDSITGLDEYTEGTEANVPALESDDKDLVFLGWYDERGNKVEGESVRLESGEKKEYYSVWRAGEIREAGIRYYENGKIPASTEVILSFPITNKGNTALRKLGVSISGDGVDVRSSSINATLIGGESSLTASYLVYVEGEKGEEKVVTATVKDQDGNVWTKDFSFIIQ